MKIGEEKHAYLFELDKELEQLSRTLLKIFDSSELKLFSIPPHKRVFLFFLTRALKTHHAIVTLCREGFGQDAAILLRSLLENLISFRYMLYDPQQVDTLASRFVAYKWVIFHRHLSEEERDVREKSKQEQHSFFQKKDLVLKNVEEFKKKYGINSGRALLTWSGRTLKDMAGRVSKDLLKEYESTFRMCSKFTHPSIISDKEYMIIDDRQIIFSVSPSIIGVETALVKTIGYTFNILFIFNHLFELKRNALLEEFSQRLKDYQGEESFVLPSPSGDPRPINRESVIVFKTGQ